MPTPTEELAQALTLIDHARVELENAASASKAMAASFLGDADRMLIDANAAVWRACSALGSSPRQVPDSSQAGTSDPKRAAAALIPQVDQARADVHALLRAIENGSAPPASSRGAAAAGVAAVPHDDPFGTPEIFDPKRSAKYVTRRRGLKLLALGILLAALGAAVGFGSLWFFEDFDMIWFLLPLPGLALAGKGLIELLHARDM